MYFYYLFIFIISRECDNTTHRVAREVGEPLCQSIVAL